MNKMHTYRYLNKLRKVSKIFRYSQADLDETLKNVLAIVSDTLKVDHLELLLWDKEEKVLEVKVVAKEKGIMNGEEEIFVSEENDLRVIVGLGRRDYIVKNKKYPEGYFPLKISNKILGVLGINNKLSGKKIKRDQLFILKEFAEEIATGIWNLELLLKEQTQTDKFKALSKIGIALVSQLKIENRIKIILRSIIKHLEIDRAKLYLVDKKKKILKGKMAFDLRGKFYDIKDNYPMEGENSSQFLMLMKKEAREVGSLGIVFSLPLKVEKKIVGFLIVDNIFSRERITGEDIEYLKLFAQQASISIENAMLFNDVERLSMTDGLTGLYTNRYFHKRLSEEFLRVKRFNGSIALAVIDVDNFKNYNDSYGHKFGDYLLVELSKTILKNIRHIDFAARYGGDEFVVFFPNTSPEGIQIAIFRLIEAVRKLAFNISGKEVHFSISIGAALYPKDTTEKDELFKKADASLYRAKLQGRDQACFFSSTMDKKQGVIDFKDT